MNVRQLHARLTMLMDAGHSEDEVFLDTNPEHLFTVGEVDLDSEGAGVIIWKELI